MIDNKLRITAGNTFATAHTITAQDVQGQPIPDFDLQECTDIQVYARNGGSYKQVTSWQLDDQSVVVMWYGRQMKLGGYDFYIAGKFNGADWRTSEATIFEIVQYNEEANIPADTIVVDGTYFLDASFSLITEIQGGGGGATPSDELPLMDGTADAGTSDKYSRGDHVHPSDTSKQDVLVSGVNIKTINNNSVLGGGNLTVGSETAIMNHGTSDTTYALTPKVFHVWGEVSSLTLTLATPSDPTVMAEYLFEFESGLTPTTLSLPASVKWAENCGDISVAAGYIYQVSIVNNVGLWISVEA